MIFFICIYFYEIKVFFNVYIFDFFEYGDFKVFVCDNGIKVGDVWFCLKDFLFILVIIVLSLVNFLDFKSGVMDDMVMIGV